MGYQNSGALFSFGPKADCDTGTLLKISQIKDQKMKTKLNKELIHHLNEERSVGFIHFEISIRGKQHLRGSIQQVVDE